MPEPNSPMAWSPIDHIAARKAAAEGRLWRVSARWQGDRPTLLVEADEAAPWTGGALYFWNRTGEKRDGRRTVLVFGPGEWFRLEAARAAPTS